MKFWIIQANWHSLSRLHRTPCIKKLVICMQIGSATGNSNCMPSWPSAGGHFPKQQVMCLSPSPSIHAPATAPSDLKDYARVESMQHKRLKDLEACHDRHILTFIFANGKLHRHRQWSTRPMCRSRASDTSGHLSVAKVEQVR